jgi:predicted amidohydrolase
MIQTQLYWEDQEKNLSHFTNLIAQNKTNADIILLPETFTTGFSMNASIAESGEETMHWMKKMAANSNAAIGGSFFIQDGDKYYNRFHFVEPDGNTTIYNKRHLFTLTNEDQLFSEGNEHVIVKYKGWKISLMVCYDLRFPVWMRRSSKNDYDLILLVANWPERRSYAWNQLLIARAIENQTYVVAVNRIGKDGNGILHSGESALIDPMGKRLAVGCPFEDEIIQGSVDYTHLEAIRKSLPFYEDRDKFNWE